VAYEGVLRSLESRLVFLFLGGFPLPLTLQSQPSSIKVLPITLEKFIK